MKFSKAWLTVIILILIAPIFGVWLAELVGYHEPLDVAAEKLNETKPILVEKTEAWNWTPLLDYTVPGLPDWLGYIVAGFIGVGIIALIGCIISKAKARGKRE